MVINVTHIYRVLVFLISSIFWSNSFAGLCSTPETIGTKEGEKKLLVIVPATSHNKENWKSFYKNFKQSKYSSRYELLFINHNINFSSTGDIREISQSISTCINQVMTSNDYDSITLIGHSIGGMLVRRAYLESAGQFFDRTVASTNWTSKVDRILLFASVNRGIPIDAEVWSPAVNWLLRVLPHPKFVLEDLAYGSDFIVDTRIAWIRYFANLSNRSYLSTQEVDYQIPHVVQFWGTEDSIVTEKDNADLEAFSGKVLERVPDATHSDLIRFEPKYTQSPELRWRLFEKHIFDDLEKKKLITDAEQQRILIILNGIRDSSNSGWVKDLKIRANKYYDASHVITPEYGYFTAAHFAFSTLRSKNIPKFRDLYAELLAKYPLAKFDFIGHSNGTYIFANSLTSTPSMQFNNVVLVAPVLPEDFEWTPLFKTNQVKSLRYDVSNNDYPVGILCQALSSLGESDVGSSGVLLFSGGDSSMEGSPINKVGWHDGGHGEALNINNREHLLNFAYAGSDLESGAELLGDVGVMRIMSNAIGYIVWAVIFGLIWWVFRDGLRESPKKLSMIVGVFGIIFIVLDIF